MRTSRHLGLALGLAILALTAVFTAIGPDAAQAQTTNATFNYSGTSNDTQTLIDTGLVLVSGCDNITDDPVTCIPDWFPGTIWFRIQAGVKSTVVTVQPADYTLDNPDTFRQDTTAGFSSTLVPKDGADKEVTVKTTPFVNIDVAYDAPFANCAGGYLAIPDTTALANADTSGCLNLVLHTGDIDITTLTIMQQDTTLPYTSEGARNLSQTESTSTIDIGAFVGVPGILGAKLNFTTDLTLTPTGGYQATRTISSSSAPGTPLVSGTIGWPDANPVNDDVALPCTVPAGDNLIYKLTNNRWSGTGNATGKVSITAVALPGSLDIDVATIPIVSATLFNGNVTANTTDFTKTLGEVLAENKPPVVTVNTPSPDPGSEGSAINFSATATDNCDTMGQLSFFWEFSDGGVGYGPSVYHTFSDNGTYSYRLTVCDRAGNCTVSDPNIVVNNVDPTVGAGPDKTSLWGLPVAFHANGADAGSVDNGSLLYSWDFDDPNSPVGAVGQDVSHTFSMPGTYNVVVTAYDKDGGSSSDTVQVTVLKRGTSLTYTGPVQALPNKRVGLTASLTDSLGQPVVGATITFTIGTQSMSAITNGSGVATASLALNQKVGTYPLSATFTGDSRYLGSSAATTFKIGNK